MSTRDRTVVLVLGLAGVLAAFWLLLLAPKREEARALGAKIEATQEQVRGAEAEVASGNSARSQYAADYTAVAELGKAVPVDDDVPSLVYQLESAADRSKVDFRSIKVATGGGGALRGALPLPALELTGCTVSQDAVARMMSRLRQVDGVERVSLASSEKAAPGAGGGGPGGDCRMGSAKYPQFQMVVFLSAPTPATTPGAATASATPAAAKTSTPAAGQSTP